MTQSELMPVPASDGPSQRPAHPTASQLPRLSLCPGAFAACAGLPTVPTPEQERGNRIHEALAKRFADQVPLEEAGLAPDELEAARFCVRAVVHLLGLETRSDAASLEFQVERRLTWEMDGAARWSGRADLVCIDGARAYVWDWKTGWTEQTPAWQNLQTRALAVLVWRAYCVAEVETVIVQPMLRLETDSLYDASSLQAAAAEIEAIVTRATAPDAPRVPGSEQCQWCPARSNCREHQVWLSDSTLLELLPLLRQEVQWSGDRWGRFLDAEPLLRKWLSDRREEARRRLQQDPSSIPGWEIRRSQRSEIKDVAAVLTRLAALGIGPADVGPFLELPMGALRQLIRTQAEAKGREAKAIEAEILRDAVQTHEVLSVVKTARRLPEVGTKPKKPKGNGDEGA